MSDGILARRGLPGGGKCPPPLPTSLTRERGVRPARALRVAPADVCRGVRARRRASRAGYGPTLMPAVWRPFAVVLGKVRFPALPYTSVRVAAVRAVVDEYESGEA